MGHAKGHHRLSEVKWIECFLVFSYPNSRSIFFIFWSLISRSSSLCFRSSRFVSEALEGEIVFMPSACCEILFLGVNIGHAGPLGFTGMPSTMQNPFLKFLHSLCVGKEFTSFADEIMCICTNLSFFIYHGSIHI